MCLAWYEGDNVNRRLLQTMSVCVSYLIRIVCCNLQHLIIEMDGPDFSRYALFRPIYIYIHIFYVSTFAVYAYMIVVHMYIMYHVYRFTSLSWLSVQRENHPGGSTSSIAATGYQGWFVSGGVFLGVTGLVVTN